MLVWSYTLVRRAANFIKEHSGGYRICQSNGISQQDYLERPEEIHRIEMIHWDFPRIEGVSRLTALRELCILSQQLSVIKGLEECVNLESLWICETNVEQIAGLDNCLKLQHLYLYSNKISKIENISHLVNLKSLWLSSNRIKRIEGLENLVNLESLWLANNQIERLGEALDHNTKLTDLNLSANHIGYFKEISHLTRLPALKRLVFKDLMFGHNPICKLGNYLTYILYHLSHLEVTEEGRQNAEATFMKKQMYYNMRIKLLNSNASNTIDVGRKKQQIVIDRLYDQLGKYVQAQRAVEQQLSKSNSNDREQQFKIAKIKGRIEEKLAIKEQLDKKFQKFQKQVLQCTEKDIGRVVTELTSGGNIRLELGESQDVWFTSCVELLHSRFFPQDYKGTGIHGLRVDRVMRIHNRHLRRRFEKQLKPLDPDVYRRNIEYLFFGEDSTSVGEIARVVERGFLSPEEYEWKNSVRMSNSVSALDALKWKREEEKGEGAASVVPMKGTLILVKLYTGNIANLEELGTPHKASISHRDFKDYDTVYRAKRDDPKQRQYFVFNHWLALPEYIIDYQYLPTPYSVDENVKSCAQNTSRGQEDIDFDVRLMNQITEEFEADSSKLVTDVRAEVEMDELRIPPFSSPLQVISESYFQRISSSFSAIETLDLCSNQITKIENLSLLVNLKRLVLSFNKIQKVEGLNELKSLETLDLGFNEIKRIESGSLRGLNSLTCLDLTSNQISKIDDISHLQKHTPHLKEISFLNNPVTSARGYISFILRKLTDVRTLDYRKITEEDRRDHGYNVLTRQIILDSSYSRKRQETLDYSSVSSKLAGRRDGIDVDNCWDHIIELDASHLGIRKIQNLEDCVQLQRIYLADNQIGRIEGLSQCTRLEELYLNDNRIKIIDGLSQLPQLLRLDLSRNSISSLENISNLVHLTQLSLCDNRLESLSGLSSLVNLVELYLAGNLISEQREVLHLKPLNRLIILDLSSNPVKSTNNYRQYVIYKNQKIRVLDGISVDTEELTNAREQYSGRLTADYLEDKLQHRNFSLIRELSLSGAKIRDIEPLSSTEFYHLRELNLDNNQITKLKGLYGLQSLVVLKLNNNRIEKMDDPPSDPIFPILQILHLGGNHIHDINLLHLRLFPSLASLNLEGNEITKVEGLDDCTNLRELILDRNRIKTLDSDAFLNLVHLKNNGISTLSGVDHLISLHTLRLSNNRIQELYELDRLSATRVKELYIQPNGVCRKPHYRQMVITANPALEVLDDKRIEVEEREKAEYNTNHPEVVIDPRVVNPVGPKVAIKMSLMTFDTALKNSAAFSGPSSLHSESPQGSPTKLRGLKGRQNLTGSLPTGQQSPRTRPPDIRCTFAPNVGVHQNMPDRVDEFLDETAIASKMITDTQPNSITV
ncbi:leucine rich repeat containing 48-like [Planoprotostelium fungivorum]|uniref:Leucine rich repeat containing 48-like n=1 Tax=Planoprotostelium fungivorum TaxID=1890364 RepID=A0A2P6NPX9_9EUKA|nr:leucine rich repeat containing 48-like [Planoprotostelium fungivorum]